MLENFNGPIYLILFIILLLANLYYAYSTLINTKSWLDKYGTHHSAVLLTRILGSLISGFVLIGIYIMFTSTAGTWSYFTTLFISYSIMTIIGIYSVFSLLRLSIQKTKEELKDLNVANLWVLFGVCLPSGLILIYFWY